MQDDQGERLVALAERCVAEDGADVIVLAGAPLAGLARQLRGRLPVPVVDGVSSAVRHAESLVALQPGRATQGSFAPPPDKPNRGLPPSIEALLRRRSLPALDQRPSCPTRSALPTDLPHAQPHAATLADRPWPPPRIGAAG